MTLNNIETSNAKHKGKVRNQNPEENTITRLVKQYDFMPLAY